MDLDGAFARILRLREQVSAALPSATPNNADAHHLTGAYVRLRREGRAVAQQAGVDVAEFDMQLPEVGVAPPHQWGDGPAQVMEQDSQAREAASLLRELAGWMDGLVDALAMQEGHDLADIERARAERRAT